jgi:tetratricopeptide (TPR) repeat protein
MTISSSSARRQSLSKLLLVTLLATSFTAFAESTDADFSTLLKARNRDAAEALARERMAKNAKDDIALWYAARLGSANAQKRDELIPRAEQCIKDLPESARCHSALGSLYGSLAMSGGMSAGLKYAGKIKDLMLRAVQLAPTNYDMRRDLNQFYLQAPGIVGGSVRKAIENSNDFGKFDATRGQLLRAEVHIYEKEFSAAESLLRGIKTTNNAEMADIVFSALTNLGFALLNNKKVVEAQKLFEQHIASHPNDAASHFGLGRALLEQKNYDAAITSIERALQIDPKQTVHYRLGMAYEGRGDKARAIAAYQKFLSYNKTGRAAEDAIKRMEALKKG